MQKSPPKTQKEEEDHVSSTKPTFFQIYSNCLRTTTTKIFYNRQFIAWAQGKKTLNFTTLKFYNRQIAWVQQKNPKILQ
jgi:hypothetical protein